MASARPEQLSGCEACSVAGRVGARRRRRAQAGSTDLCDISLAIEKAVKLADSAPTAERSLPRSKRAQPGRRRDEGVREAGNVSAVSRSFEAGAHRPRRGVSTGQRDGDLRRARTDVTVAVDFSSSHRWINSCWSCGFGQRRQWEVACVTDGRALNSGVEASIRGPGVGPSRR